VPLPRSRRLHEIPHPGRLAHTPQPDPNPLDCNGHGSHVAGTAAGFGVTAAGTTFTGPYDDTTYTNNAFTIGPGVAPKADLYAVRVFGCSGPTDVVTEAIEWAIDNDMDVVNMSLGADFTTGDSADALAADNAMKAGVVVVSAQGNAGDIHYAVGAPGSSRKGIAVAASAREGFDPTADFALPAIPGGPAAKTINAIDANGIPFTGSLTVTVLRTATGGVSLGCDPAEYAAQNVTGKLVVTQRGTCARVARAIFGQEAGAAAVVMINNGTTLPPFEGPITSNPDTGQPFVVSIPFFGVRGLAATATSDGFALVQRDGQSIGITAGAPIQTGLASFTSTGPRSPDSLLKPDITAPGVNIGIAVAVVVDENIEFLLLRRRPALEGVDREHDQPIAAADAEGLHAGRAQVDAPQLVVRALEAPRVEVGRARHEAVRIPHVGDAKRRPVLQRQVGGYVRRSTWDDVVRHAQRDPAVRRRGRSEGNEPGDVMERVEIGRRVGKRSADGGRRDRQRQIDRRFAVFSVDFGLLTVGAHNGQIVAAIVNLHAHTVAVDFFAVAAANGSTILLPVLGPRGNHAGESAVRLHRRRLRPRQQRSRHLHGVGGVQRLQQRDQHRAVRHGGARRRCQRRRDDQSG